MLAPDFIPAVTIDPAIGIRGGHSVSNGGATNAQHPIVTGTASPGAIIDLYDGDEFLGTAINYGTRWLYSFGYAGSGGAIAEGVHELRAHVRGLDTPLGWSLPVSLTVDRHIDVRIDYAIGTDSGIRQTIQSGDATRDNTLRLSGQADAGAQVEVYSQGRGFTGVLGETVADSNGRWSFTTPALADGMHSLGIYARDGAGNTAFAFGPGITVDTQVSDAELSNWLGVHAGKLRQAVGGGFYTNDSQPSLAGRAESGATVDIYDGSRYVTTVKQSGFAPNFDGSASWYVSLPRQAAGLHSYTARITDAAGNQATTTALAVGITSLIRSDVAQHLDGTRGNDLLAGGGGADTIHAGAGDDLIAVSDMDYASIDGGAGRDTLQVTMSDRPFALDGSPLHALRDIEAIDIRGNGHTDMLVAVAGVNALRTSMPGAPGLLDIFLDADDSLYLYQQGLVSWIDLRTAVDSNGQGWHLYTHPALLGHDGIRPLIRVGIPPGAADVSVHLS